MSTQNELLYKPRIGNMTLIVKPTNDCNLDCAYCYDKPIRKYMKSTKITTEILDHSLGLVNNYCENATILWHGGEPTLMGHDFYYKANELMSKYYATKFNQQLQTNGLEIYRDVKWLTTFTECDIAPGTSYDGIYQYLRQGNTKEYMEEVMHMLCDAKLGSLGGITIVHNDNLYKLTGYYEYIKNKFGTDYDLTLNLGFSTEETNVPLFNLYPDHVYSEYLKLYRTMLKDTDTKAILETNFARNILGLLKPHQGKGCELVDCRKRWLTILADGTLIPCSRFSVYHTFGNVMEYKERLFC